MSAVETVRCTRCRKQYIPSAMFTFVCSRCLGEICCEECADLHSDTHRSEDAVLLAMVPQGGVM